MIQDEKTLRPLFGISVSVLALSVSAACSTIRATGPAAEEQIVPPVWDGPIGVPEIPAPVELEDPNKTGVFPPRPVGIEKVLEPAFQADPNVLTDEEAGRAA